MFASLWCVYLQDVRYFFVLLGLLYGGFAICFNMQLGGGPADRVPTLMLLFATVVGDFSHSFVNSLLLEEEGEW